MITNGLAPEPGDRLMLDVVVDAFAILSEYACRVVGDEQACDFRQWFAPIEDEL